MQTVNASEFEQKVLQSPQPVLVDFYADWCGPCHVMTPILEQLAEDRADQLKVVKLDIDENPDVAARYGVQSIPTLIFFSAGEEKKRVIGTRPKSALERELDLVPAGA